MTDTKLDGSGTTQTDLYLVMIIDRKKFPR